MKHGKESRCRINAVEQVDLAGGEVCTVGWRRARPYGMAS